MIFDRPQDIGQQWWANLVAEFLEKLGAGERQT